LITLVAVPLLLLFLGSGDPTDMMELFNLVPVREAYRDGHWLMPTLNGAPRFEKPPLAVWLPAALVQLLHADSLWVLRLPSLLLGLLTAFCTYGIGCRLFQNPAEPRSAARRMALLAALFVPSMLLFNRQSRLGSYDIYAAAFTTASVYFLLSLIDDARHSATAGRHLPVGRWLGWTALAGVALGLSLLSKGPAPPATVFVPLLLWLAIFHRSKAIWLSVAALLLVSVATSVPWVLAIMHWYPAAWTTWRNEASKLSTGRRTVGSAIDYTLRDPIYYYLQIFLWAIPLTPTFIAGLAMPFFKPQSTPLPSDTERQGRWLLWMIILGGVILLSIPAEKKPRYTVQLFPYIALLCAAVWQEFIRLDRRRRLEPAALAVLAGQALFFLIPGALAIAAGVWVLTTGSFFKWPAVAAILKQIGPSLVITLGGLLTAGGIYLHRLQSRRLFAPAAGVLALCAALFMLSVQWAYRSLPETTLNPVRLPVEAAVAAAGPAPIYTLPEGRPWIRTLFFANRTLTVTDPADLIRRAHESPDQPLFLMLIQGTVDGKNAFTPIPGTADRLAQIEAATGRRWTPVNDWLDEGRRTALLKLTP
jgi:4-amino-4-deoxy-L-arabinose transferase-like glycosyltransferase